MNAKRPNPNYPSQKDWLGYFERNAKNLLFMERDTHLLSPQERHRVCGSIQAFQVGESSEGAFLRAKSKVHAERSRNADYPHIIQYLIREENRHSAYLLHFMKCHKIRPSSKPWSDRAFRFFRNLGGLETSIRVLVSAETLSLAYYSALHDATDSALLKKICGRMLSEEKAHIKFQWSSIQHINSNRSEFVSAIADCAHTFFTFGTSIVMWWEHRQVLREKYSFLGYLSWISRKHLRSMIFGRKAATRLFPKLSLVKGDSHECLETLR